MIDLEEEFNFTNKLKHPSNPMKVVYRHFVQEQADYFSTLLVDAKIDFEAQIDEEDERKPTYFGVAKAKESQVDRLNYTALGKGRDKFIASAAMRWIILSISILILLLAVLGAMLDA